MYYELERAETRDYRVIIQLNRLDWKKYMACAVGARMTFAGVFMVLV